MSPREVEQYLNSFANYELSFPAASASLFKLDRVRLLLESLGSPQKRFKALHVAGTKGKGSSCVFAANILKAAGYKVGLYTSPHLKDFKERIRILGDEPQRRVKKDTCLFNDCISDEEIGILLKKVKPRLEKFRATRKYGNLTYFEVLTALAWCYFKDKEVDFAVLETGLGGRLDATNAVDSLVCAITPISLDHTSWLGSTLGRIASEKAAIIKATGQTVVVAPQTKEALAVIQKRCRQKSAHAYYVGSDIRISSWRQDIDGQKFCVKGIRNKYFLETRLLGKHQAVNAAVAVGLMEGLARHGIFISPDAVVAGISETSWPGRFEVMRKKPFVILDGAHNPASCRQLAKTVKELFPRKKIILILGVSQDKERRGICRELVPLARKIIFTQARHPRAHTFREEEAKNLSQGKEFHCIPHARRALSLALTNVAKDDVILVAGSLFLVGEARAFIKIPNYKQQIPNKPQLTIHKIQTFGI